MMFQIGLQILYIDDSLSLKSFSLDLPENSQLKMTLSALDSTFDMCYSNDYIQKAAYV
jgi:hypothetical protein